MKLLARVLFGIGLVLGLGNTAWAGLLPADATNVREVKIFRNVSGASTTSGTAFILQENNTDSNVLVGNTFGSESSLGLDVTTTTGADSDDFVGVQVDDTCVDDGLCRVVTYGPVIARWCGTTDNTNTRLADVGTCNGVAGQLGAGTLAGVLLSLTLDQTTLDTVGTTAGETNGAANNELRWIWVRPEGN